MVLLLGGRFCTVLRSEFISWLLLAVFVDFLPTVIVRYVAVNNHALNDFISYYEPVRDEVLFQAQAAKHEKQVLYYYFQAFGRKFELELKISSSILSPFAQIELYDHNVTKYESTIKVREYLVEGRLVGDPTSFVRGDIYEGSFVGMITVSNEQYFVESSSKYFQEHVNFKSVIFRRSDIKYKVHKYSATDHIDIPDILDESGGAGKSRSREFFLKSLNQNTLSKAHLHRKRRSWKAWENNICSLLLMADHTFFKFSADEDMVKVVTDMVQMIQEANKIFSETDFNEDGIVDDISLKVAKVVVWKEQGEAGYTFGNVSRGPAEILMDITKGYDFSQYCLAVVFVHRPWKYMHVAYQGSPKPSDLGGICSEFHKGSYNIAVANSQDDKRVVPAAVRYVVVTHVIGHSFGSPHDPHTAECYGADKRTRFIMTELRDTFPFDHPHNMLFSPCSKEAIAEVIDVKGTCLTQDSGPTCGNTVIEEEEECDCGQPNQCDAIDRCCHPVGDANECKLRTSLGTPACTPRAERCCNDNCTLDLDTDREDCDYHEQCKEADTKNAKPDGTPCLDDRSCIDGLCKTKKKLPATRLGATKPFLNATGITTEMPASSPNATADYFNVTNATTELLIPSSSEIEVAPNTTNVTNEMPNYSLSVNSDETEHALNVTYVTSEMPNSSLSKTEHTPNVTNVMSEMPTYSMSEAGHVPNRMNVTTELSASISTASSGETENAPNKTNVASEKPTSSMSEREQTPQMTNVTTELPTTILTANSGETEHAPNETNVTIKMQTSSSNATGHVSNVTNVTTEMPTSNSNETEYALKLTNVKTEMETSSSSKTEHTSNGTDVANETSTSGSSEKEYASNVTNDTIEKPTSNLKHVTRKHAQNGTNVTTETPTYSVIEKEHASRVNNIATEIPTSGSRETGNASHVPNIATEAATFNSSETEHSPNTTKVTTEMPTSSSNKTEYTTEVTRKTTSSRISVTEHITTTGTSVNMKTVTASSGKTYSVTDDSWTIIGALLIVLLIFSVIALIICVVVTIIWSRKGLVRYTAGNE